MQCGEIHRRVSVRDYSYERNDNDDDDDDNDGDDWLESVLEVSAFSQASSRSVLPSTQRAAAIPGLY